jgi:hypothetical protein
LATIKGQNGRKHRFFKTSLLKSYHIGVFVRI